MSFLEWIKSKQNYKGAGIVFTDGKKILLLKRSLGNNKGSWCPPGGTAEIGENPIKTAKRESKEECGNNKGKNIGKVSSTDFYNFIFKISKLFKVKLSNEHNDFDWIDIKKVKEIDLHPGFKKDWPKIKNKIESYFN